MLNYWSDENADKCWNARAIVSLFCALAMAEQPASSSSDDSDSGSSSSDEEKDYFHYPKATDNAWIVANDIMPMTTPDKWLHPFSAIHWSGGMLLRLTIIGLEWPGRCFDCKLNNKSSVFCFFGQNTKDGSYGTPLTQELQLRLRRIRCFAADTAFEKAFYSEHRLAGMQEGAIDDAFDSVPFAVKKKYPVDPLRIFPDQDVIIEVKSVNRASRQHYIPPIRNLLCQKPFSEYFDETTFFEFLKTRQTLTVGTGSFARTWHEPKEQVDEREGAMASMRLKATRRERVGMVMTVITTLYKQWTTGSKCTAGCRLYKCGTCSFIRSHFRKEYKDQVRKVVHDRIANMFETRTGPFKGFSSAAFNGEKFENSECRIVQIHNTKA